MKRAVHDGREEGFGMFTTESQGGTTVVVIGADLDSGNTAQAREFINGLTDGGRINLVADLSGMGFVDSSGLGALVAALKAARSKGGDLRLCGVVPAVSTILELTRLTKLFQVFPDRESAVASFQTES